MAGKKTVFSFAEGASATEENRLAELDVEDGEGEIQNSVLNRVIALKEEHERYLEIDRQYKAERVLLEKRFFEQKQAVFTKRAEIVTGTCEVASRVAVEPDDDVKNVPGFWAAAIANHELIGHYVTDEDMDALEKINNIRVEYNEDWSGFSLIFEFAPNKYFTNTELRKTYEVSPDLLEERAPELNSVEGTKIEWLPSQNLCVTETKKKQKAKSGRNAGQVRYVTKTEPKASFFHYFSDPKAPDDNEDEEDEEEDDKDKGDDGFTLSLDEDYEIAHSFRTDLIPDALLWYTGEANGEDEDGLEEIEDDEENEENDEDDDEPAHESEDVVGGNASTGFTSAQPGAAGEQAPECKQS